MQSLERVLLKNQITELKHNEKPNQVLRNQAASQLIDLQDFMFRVIKDGKADNLKLWHCMSTYADVLRSDHYQAEVNIKYCRNLLTDKDEYETELLKQLDIWEHLLRINQLRMDDTYAEDAAFRLRSYAIHTLIPTFEPYLKDRLGLAYGKTNQPGKAVVTAFSQNALLFNPKLDQLDDLILSLEAANGATSAIETEINSDSLMRPNLDFFLEAKGMALLAMAQPEAALQELQRQSAGYKGDLFSPFKERISERINDVAIADTINVTREELAAKILEFQFAARANFTQPDKAAKYYYLLGLCYYNCSYFGYSWKTFDAFRSGQNWTRLSQGPVFGAANTPYGNSEVLDMRTALGYFEQALRIARNTELQAKCLFMAARCQQKQWFADPKCQFRPGNKEIPVIPDAYADYQKLFFQKCSKTEFYKQVVSECKWYEAYARRK